MSQTLTLPRIRLVSRSVPTALDREQIIIRFMSIQFFTVIYLQKFALLSHTFPLSIPMLVMVIGSCWMILLGHLPFRPASLALYLMFVGCCLISQAFVGGSFPSVVLLFLLYIPMTTIARVSEETHHKLLNRFIMMMILPAGIVIEQYMFQKLTGKTDWLSMDNLMPSAILSQGFNYAGHVPWNSPFIRPQGFFFLEPSFVSAFLATAAIMEITYFRRWWVAILMIAACGLSQGATGITMIIIAVPFLLLRETPRVMLSVSALLIVVVGMLLAFGVNLPVISRADELETKSSSSGERLTMPAIRLGELLADPGYWIVGSGAGKTTPYDNHKRLLGGVKALQKAYSSRKAVMNPWPSVKLLNEYGLPAMVTFMVFYFIGIAGRFNVPLKVALTVIYMFTGGYLLNPILVEILIFLCCVITPIRKPDHEAT